MKSDASFEIRAYIKGGISLKMSGSQTFNELCLIHEKSTVSKSSAFRWHKKFQDGKTDQKDGTHLGQPKTAATKANFAAVATIVGILTFISMINTTSERFKARNFFICRYLVNMSSWNFVLS